MRISKEIKDNNVKQLEYAAKEFRSLAMRMKTCDPNNESHADMLGSSVVEASFFINAFGLASQAFRNMVTDLNQEDSEGPRGDVLFYLFEEAAKFEQEVEEKRLAKHADNISENTDRSKAVTLEEFLETEEEK